MITVTHARKASATSSRSTTSRLDIPAGSLTALLGPERLGQVDPAARPSPGSRRLDSAWS